MYRMVVGMTVAIRSLWLHRDEWAKLAQLVRKDFSAKEDSLWKRIRSTVVVFWAAVLSGPVVGHMDHSATARTLVGTAGLGLSALDFRRVFKLRSIEDDVKNGKSPLTY